MTINQRHFLAFIRFALMGGEYPHGLLTEANWQEQLKIAKKQTVSGMLHEAVLKLPESHRPSAAIIAKLKGYVTYYEDMNALLNKQTCEIFRVYKEMGYHPILLKGQGASVHYPKPSIRVFGDIDVFVPDGDDRLKAWIEEQADKIMIDPRRSHVFAFSWHGVTIENHFCLVRFYNKKLFANMESIVKEAALEEFYPDFVEINGKKIEVLPPTIGLLYHIVHFSRHLIVSGVGVRQLCDIMLHIHCLHDKIDREKLRRWIDEMEIGRMANAVAAACVKYLGLPAEEVPFDYKNNEWGDKADELMHIVMEGANSGYWKMLGKKQKPWKRFKLYLQQQFRIYPFMPREVRTEVWLKLTNRFK